MKHTAASFSVVGKVEKNFWSQTLAKNNLYLVVEVTGEAASQAGMSFLHEVEKQLPATGFTSAAILRDFLRRTRRQNLGIHYVAAFLREQKLFLTAEGGGETWLVRGAKKGRVLKDNGVVSGAFFPGDLLLLISSQFVASLSPWRFKKILECTDIQDIAEAATVAIHEQADKSQGAALLFTSGAISTVAKSMPIRLTSWKLETLKIFITCKNFLQNNLKINTYDRRKKLVLGALVVVFLLSIIWGLVSNDRHIQPKQVDEDLVTVSHKLEEGVALIDLNPLRSRELLQEAKDILQDLTETRSQSKQKEVEAMFTKVTAAYELALRRFDVTLSPFYELSLIKPGASGTDFSLFQDALIVLDARGKSVYRLLLSTKTPKILGGGDSLLTGAQLVGSDEEVYVLNNEGVQKVVLPEGTLFNVIAKDNEWGSISDMQAFSGNLYLLDRQQHIIWKYVRTETGFSPRQNYLLADSKPDLSGATSLSIDGAVWVVKGNQILKFVGGEEAVWKTQGLNQAWGSSLGLYTDEYTAKLYILDKDNKRVLVFDKNGLYLSQYQWQADVSISHLVVSEPLKKILLLSSATIYGIDLK